jgi:hypothetical protein
MDGGFVFSKEWFLVKQSQIRPVFLACGLAALLGQAIVAPGETFTRVTGEGSKVQYDLKKDQGNGWYTESSSPYRFKLGFKQGERHSTDPVQVATIGSTTKEHYVGNAAIQMEIVARDELKSKKAAYKVTIDSVGPQDSFAPSVVAPRDWYHGFAMKIDPAFYELPSEGHLLFEQWWQGSPFHPPIALVIVNQRESRANGWADAGAKGNFALVLRDDEHNADEETPGRPKLFNLGPVTTGQWLQWVVQVRPSAVEAKGTVRVVLNGKEILNLQNVKVGYNPANPQYQSHKPSNKIATVNVCLYRLNGQNFQRFYFDEIRFADSFEDASPGK